MRFSTSTRNYLFRTGLSYPYCLCILPHAEMLPLYAGCGMPRGYRLQPQGHSPETVGESRGYQAGCHHTRCSCLTIYGRDGTQQPASSIHVQKWFLFYSLITESCQFIFPISKAYKYCTIIRLVHKNSFPCYFHPQHL